LNPNFDTDRELLLGQIDDLKNKVNQLAHEKVILEINNCELQEKVNLPISNIVIAEDRKIDVIKVLHSMCKIGLFKMKDGSKFTIKEVMKFFGEILNDNFTEYSSNLSTSKATTKESTFLEVFEELHNAAKKYLKKS
jgi:regulator of replication initiation timing